MRFRDVFLVLLLVACLSSVSAANTVNISFWHGETQPVRVEAFQYIIDKFQEEYPNIKVTQSAVSNTEAFPKMMAALSTGTNPEMAFSTPDRTMAYWSMGFAQPHDALVEKIDALHEYIPKPKSLYYFEDHYWAVPTWSITLMLFYREDLLAEAGFDGPPETWDELLEMAEALTKDGRYGIALPASSGQNATDQVVWSFMSTNNAEVFDRDGNIVFNNPKTIETYEFLAKLSQFSPPDSTGWGWGETRLAFTSGRAAMSVLFGSVLLDLVQQTDFADDVKAVTIPIPVGGKTGGLTHTESVMIFTTDAAKKDACEKFIEFFFRPEIYGLTMAAMQPGLTLPITKTGMESPDFLEDPILTRYSLVMENTLKQVHTGSLYGFMHEVRNPAVGEIGVNWVPGETFQRIVSKQMTVKQAVEWGHNRMLSIAE